MDPNSSLSEEKIKRTELLTFDAEQKAYYAGFVIFL
jgi:hypothetical protein